MPKPCASLLPLRPLSRRDYQQAAHARLVVHLEDNEDFLLASWIGRPLEELASVTEAVAQHAHKERKGSRLTVTGTFP